MKAVFIGGGALRHLSTLRGAMAAPGVLDGGQIVLYDLDPARAEAMGRMLLKTPEYDRCRCDIAWDQPLEKALEGADVVSVVLMGGSRLSYALGHGPSLEHGYISSDNLSPSGALLAVKTAPIITNLARQMKRRCPGALLLDFANPVAVLAALASTHFGINALGVCAGYTNHQWDIARVLGKDRRCDALDVQVAGVNHLSFILDGTVQGRDLFEVLRRRLRNPFHMPPLSKRWGKVMKGYIHRGVTRLVEHFQDLGVLIFSTEGDGMAHLDYESVVARSREHHTPRTRAQMAAQVKADGLRRRQQDAEFRALLDQDLAPAFWESRREDYVFGREPDIFVRILTAVGRDEPTKIVASRPNGGAVRGFTDQAVLEYSMIVKGKHITPAGTYEVPPVVRGITDGLATHQTMLAEALATEDPRLLAHALLVYPVRPYSADLRALMKTLLRINAKEIPAPFRRAAEYL